MFISDSVIESVAVPGFLVGTGGELLRINRHGYVLLERVLNLRISNIRQLDSDFDGTIQEEQSRTIQINNLSLNVRLYPGFSSSDPGGEPREFLYLVDTVLYNADFMRLMDAFEDIITISNTRGVIEFVNRSSFSMTGTHYGIGTDTHDMKGNQILNEPVSLDVLRSKKPVASRVAYSSGSTLLNRAYPLFGENGDIDKIIILAQDTSNLLMIDERLFAQELENRGHQIELDEFDRFLRTEEVIAASPAMRRIFLMAYKVAPSDAPVFLQGESGVGKEIVAQFIHHSSKRARAPFVAVNCSAIPQELFEAEMFGYERGAFTGASAQGKKGLFEQANGGTVFLDEVGELPLPMQSKLLRAIQENKIRRVGGIQDIKLDVRYISATNLSMTKVLDESCFRRDLYYRLSVVSLMIPPLRERREDILPLVTHFLRYYNRKSFGEQSEHYVRIAKKELRRLMKYDWPGNIRELRNVVERIVILAEGTLVIDIPNELLSPGGLASRSGEWRIPPPDRDGRGSAPARSAGHLDNQQIIEAYRDCGGSVYAAARKLGIAPSTIYRKLKSGALTLPKL